MITRKTIALATAALLMLAVTVVYAGHGKGMGCNQDVSIDNIKQFQKDTSTLRDEMMVKRIELQREQAKDKLDNEKISALKQETKALRTQIHEAGKKYGMFTNCDQKECGEDGDCGMMGGDCGKDCSSKAGKSKGKKHSHGCDSCNKKAK